MPTQQLPLTLKGMKMQAVYPETMWKRDVVLWGAEPWQPLLAFPCHVKPARNPLPHSSLLYLLFYLRMDCM